MKEKIIGLSIIGITLGVVTLVGGYNNKVEQELVEKQEVVIETEEIPKEIVNVMEFTVEVAMRKSENGEISGKIVGEIDHYENRNIKIEVWTKDSNEGQMLFVKNLSDYEIELTFKYEGDYEPIGINDNYFDIYIKNISPNEIGNFVECDCHFNLPFECQLGVTRRHLRGYSYNGGLEVYADGYTEGIPYKLEDIEINFSDTIPHNTHMNFDNVKITQYYK